MLHLTLDVERNSVTELYKIGENRVGGHSGPHCPFIVDVRRPCLLSRCAPEYVQTTILLLPFIWKHSHLKSTPALQHSASWCPPHSYRSSRYQIGKTRHLQSTNHLLWLSQGLCRLLKIVQIVVVNGSCLWWFWQATDHRWRNGNSQGLQPWTHVNRRRSSTWIKLHTKRGRNDKPRRQRNVDASLQR